MASDPLSAVLLATRAPILLAPSMNVNMWDHPITRANLRRLIDARGVFVVGPGDGFLACRWTGPGRLAEPADIAEAAARVLTAQDLAQTRIVVTAGATREPIDPVRFLGNRSTGKMGFAIANAASRRGATVQLIAGPTHLLPVPGVELTRVTTALEMQRAVRGVAADADAVIMAAAVADFRPAQPASHKIAKSSGALSKLALELNPDILAELGAARSSDRSPAPAEPGTTPVIGGGDPRTPRPMLVGFAAETHDVVARAQAKLAAKRCDLIVANDVSRPDAGFEVDTNAVTFVTADSTEPMELSTKDQVAHELCRRVAALLSR